MISFGMPSETCMGVAPLRSVVSVRALRPGGARHIAPSRPAPRMTPSPVDAVGSGGGTATGPEELLLTATVVLAEG